VQVSSTTLNDHFNTSSESVWLGHEGDKKIRLMSFSGLFKHAVTCTDMLQGIMTHPTFQFIPDVSRVKLCFLLWQIL
jgi:hypothetical protein